MSIELQHSTPEHIGSQPLLSVALLSGLLPVGRSKLEQASVRPIGQQAKQVAQVVAGLDVVQPAARKQYPTLTLEVY